MALKLFLEIKSLPPKLHIFGVICVHWQSDLGYPATSGPVLIWI